MAHVLDPSLADKAKTALHRHAWEEAFGLLSEADARGELGPSELELLAQSAWWVGQLPVAIGARERAYAALMKAGDKPMATVEAVRLGHDHLLKGVLSVANAWL